MREWGNALGVVQSVVWSGQLDCWGCNRHVSGRVTWRDAPCQCYKNPSQVLEHACPQIKQIYLYMCPPPIPMPFTNALTLHTFPCCDIGLPLTCYLYCGTCQSGSRTGQTLPKTYPRHIERQPILSTIHYVCFLCFSKPRCSLFHKTDNCCQLAT
jgi:hypothetical protein